MSPALSSPSSFFYSLNDTIQKLSIIPYLGIQLSNNLKWAHHINTISNLKKANCILGFLHRNLWCCPTACKWNAYLALSCPLLEYGAISWDLYLKQDIDKMERIQQSTARYIVRGYKSQTPGFVTGNLHKHDLPTLHGQCEWLSHFHAQGGQGTGASNASRYILYPPETRLPDQIQQDKRLCVQKPGWKLHPKQWQTPHSATQQHWTIQTLLLLKNCHSLELHRQQHSSLRKYWLF